MKILTILAALGLMAATTAGIADERSAIDELNMGLSKTSVFDTPTPNVYTYSDAKPGYNDRLAKAWDELPPQIPHLVEEYLPVLLEDNQCLDCHDKPKYIGRPWNTDRTVKSHSPMSRNHYATKELEDVSGARYNCMQCHVPQSNAAPLVDNTYR
jgi:cytochrome c-type protein NapB